MLSGVRIHSHLLFDRFKFHLFIVRPFIRFYSRSKSQKNFFTFNALFLYFILNCRLDQALGVFDIERETPTNETTHQTPHDESDSIVGSDMKVEITSDEESSVSEQFSCSGEAEALQTYSRLNSTESSMDQRSTCSPSTSNQPLNSPITSPAPQMMHLGSIKIEPIETEYETMIFPSTEKEKVEKFADTSHEPTNSNIIFSTNTCTATSTSQTRSGQNAKKDATNSVGRESLKRMHSVDAQSDEVGKMRKIDQNVTNQGKLISNVDLKKILCHEIQLIS